MYFDVASCGIQQYEIQEFELTYPLINMFKQQQEIYQANMLCNWIFHLPKNYSDDGFVQFSI